MYFLTVGYFFAATGSDVWVNIVKLNKCVYNFNKQLKDTPSILRVQLGAIN